MAVAAGATAGAGARWAVAEGFPEPDGWPWPVFVVNVVGSLVLGVVLARTRHRTDDATSDRLRLLIGTGFCGALTTFATFAVEVAEFLRDGRATLGLGYLAASVVVGLAAFVIGHRVGRGGTDHAAGAVA